MAPSEDGGGIPKDTVGETDADPEHSGRVHSSEKLADGLIHAIKIRQRIASIRAILANWPIRHAVEVD
jgi:hypothetical protein